MDWYCQCHCLWAFIYSSAFTYDFDIPLFGLYTNGITYANFAIGLRLGYNPPQISFTFKKHNLDNEEFNSCIEDLKDIMSSIISKEM